MNIQKEEAKEFKFSTEKVEKNIGIAILIFFFLTFNTYNNAAINIGIFAFTAVVFIYYFGWYRKKPPYVVIKGNEVIISPFPFFKPISINGDSIQKITKEDNGFVLSYTDNNETKRIKLYSIVLDPKDQKAIKNLINEMIKKG